VLVDVRYDAIQHLENVWVAGDVRVNAALRELCQFVVDEKSSLNELEGTKLT